jgi:hypothetical protein
VIENKTVPASPLIREEKDAMIIEENSTEIVANTTIQLNSKKSTKPNPAANRI